MDDNRDNFMTDIIASGTIATSTEEDVVRWTCTWTYLQMRTLLPMSWTRQLILRTILETMRKMLWMKILNVPIRYIYTLYVYTTPECILYPECTLAKWRKPDQLAARLSGALVCPAPTHPSATSRPHHLPQAVAGHPFLSILKKIPVPISFSFLFPLLSQI
jgi:hypothetical protein